MSECDRRQYHGYRRQRHRWIHWGLGFLGLVFAMAIIGGGVGSWVSRQFAPNKAPQAAANLTVLQVALQLFYADAGRFPTTREGLAVLRQPDYRGPYLTDDISVDPWGRPFLYSFSGTGVPTVSTLGADGVIGGTGEDRDFHIRPILGPHVAPSTTKPDRGTQDSHE